MPNFRLTLSYDGSRYNGWQRQGNTDNTLQAKVETLLSRLLDQPVTVQASGRTDAGVHARAQTVSFHAATALTPEQLLTQLRRYLPEDVGAEALTLAPERFHARLSCRRKTYVYRLWQGDAPCVFCRRYVHRVDEPLDTSAMARAAERLLGRHDFAAFSSVKSKKSTVRTLERIDFAQEGPELRLSFTGDGFLYNMVRILTGTLLEVGAGRLTPEAVDAILASGDRQQAGPTAPAKGLCLWSTEYD